jgi:hypothetical protein
VPSYSGSEMPGWPLALNTGVNGVNNPERVNVAIGSGAPVSSVPSGSGRSASAGVSSASYGARKETSRRANACSATSASMYWTAPSLPTIE